jgi:hypothetical protein
MLNTTSRDPNLSSLDTLAEKRDGGEEISGESVIKAFREAALEGHQIHRPGSVARLVDKRVFSSEELRTLRDLALEAAHKSYQLIGNGLYRQIQNPQHFVQTLLYHELAAKAERLENLNT